MNFPMRYCTQTPCRQSIILWIGRLRIQGVCVKIKKQSERALATNIPGVVLAAFENHQTTSSWHTRKKVFPVWRVLVFRKPCLFLSFLSIAKYSKSWSDISHIHETKKILCGLRKFGWHLGGQAQTSEDNNMHVPILTALVFSQFWNPLSLEIGEIKLILLSGQIFCWAHFLQTTTVQKCRTTAHQSRNQCPLIIFWTARCPLLTFSYN